MKLQDIDERVNELYSKVNDGQTEIRDEIHDVYVTCDGIDSEVKNIEGYCSSINSNIDQLKD
jgi:predicted  nucleic acid-binding Zn-ribbon protein